MIGDKLDKRIYRVLCIDGGGMRGIYSATYLKALASAYSRKRGIAGIDLGASFDLIAGTSTGAILACALAKNVPLDHIIALYEENGVKIFPERMPKSKLRLFGQLIRRSRVVAMGRIALADALSAELKDDTIGDIWRDRGIALAIPAVEMSRLRSWVFKTPHLANSKHRDDNYRLVDVCLASTAAPVYRSLTAIDNPDDDEHHVFVDGGLWANNPVLVGLTDALLCTEPGDRIEVFCLGTSPAPEGEFIDKGNVDWGLAEWEFGSKAAKTSIAAQEYAYDNIARMIAGQIKDREVSVDRFPSGCINEALLPYLSLDETSREGLSALKRQALTDVSEAMSKFGDPSNPLGKRMDDFFMNTKPILQEADNV